MLIQHGKHSFENRVLIVDLETFRKRVQKASPRFSAMIVNDSYRSGVNYPKPVSLFSLFRITLCFYFWAALQLYQKLCFSVARDMWNPLLQLILMFSNFF